MDVPNKVVVVLVFSVLTLAISNVAALDFLVGDEKGWTINVDYRAWAKGKIFQVGDRLVFRYEAGAHNVVQVKRDAFKNCKAISTSKVLTSGNDVVELTTSGRKWYISNVGDQCSDGQKLAITVFPTALRPLFPDISPGPAPPLPFWPFIPGIPYRPGYQIPPNVAPTPTSSSETPSGWWKLFPPMSNAPSPATVPAPSFEFPWKLFFPPSPAPAPAMSFDFPWKLLFPPSAAPAPAPSFNFPWKLIFPPSATPAPAPTFDFPWKLLFPPSAAPAPAPTFDFPWKLLFPPTAAPAPSIEFPWKWLFPPMSNAPSSSPPYDMNHK